MQFGTRLDVGDGRRAEIETLISEHLTYRRSNSVTVKAEVSGWLPGVGWVLEASIYDHKTYTGPSADLILVPDDGAPDLGASATRLIAAVEALQQPEAAEQALLQPIPETLGLPEMVYDERMFDPTPYDHARRGASLAKMRGRFPAVAERFQRVYGLRLPEHMAVFAAFWDSLNDWERRGMEYLGRSATYVTSYFEDGGLDLTGHKGLDERLEGRFRLDPPEFVSIMHGDSDGLHYGLWYDDPRDPPTRIAHNYARDDATTGSHGKLTGLAELVYEIEELIYDPPDDDEAEAARVEMLLLPARKALAAFAGADQEAVAKDGIDQLRYPRQVDIDACGIGLVLPPDSGDARDHHTQRAHRSDVYRAAHKASSPELAQWIAEARQELDRGLPALALVIGRELHFYDIDEYRADGLDLLVRAYRAMGRDALADIATVHHAHRDLPSVGVLVPSR